MKHGMWMATVVLALSSFVGFVSFVGCNIATGDCHLRGSEPGDVGAVGVGVGASTGPGNPGESPSGGALPTSVCNEPVDDGSGSGTPPGNNQGSSCDLGAGGAGGGPAQPEGNDTATFCADPCAPECAGVAQVFYFDPSVFKFVTVIADDGTGEGGGWQQAKATLDFVRPDTAEAWSCTITVGMPLRAKLVGVITPQDAATVSAAISTQASQALRKAPKPGYCTAFKETMNALFKKGASAGIGAVVNLN